MNFKKFTALAYILILVSSCGVNFKTIQHQKNTYLLTTESQLNDEKHLNAIENFYDNGKGGYFEGKASIQIYYKIFKQSSLKSPAILISSGRTEAAIKYKELIFDLYTNGYSVYILDHRGQGLSGRMTKDSHMGYIDTFQYYIDDMKFFYDNMLQEAKHQKKYLLAHSMGGAIGMTYLEQNSSDFNAAAFSSPMLGLHAPICTASRLLTPEEPKYAIGQGKFQKEDLNFENNTLTGSKIRYQLVNAAYADKPDARIGGATYQWLYKSCKQFEYITDNINKIETPFILFSAENESIVNPKAHQDFIQEIKKLGKAHKAFLIKNAQHELFIEKDEQRSKTLKAIFNYFKRY